MQKKIVFAILICISPGWLPAGGDASVAKSGASTEKSPSKFTDAQVSRVVNWMRTLAPACTTDVLLSASQRFLTEMAERRPDRITRLLAEDFELGEVESVLLRALGAELGAASQSALREEIAVKRVQMLLSREAGSPASAAAAIELISRLRSTSQVYHRRLVEGRMEDDDLTALLKRGRQGPGANVAAKISPPAAMTATEIASEFARRNQTGSSVARLRAYTAEGVLRLPDGLERQMVLFRARPNLFRLAVSFGGRTQYLLAGDGKSYWQQAPGGEAQSVSQASMGIKQYLGEFVNPLFGNDGYIFQRLDDGVMAGKKIYRMEVRRPDGSTYVSCIEAETFRECARELAKDLKIVFSDFREICGVTFAFKEETSDAKGVVSTFDLSQLTANSGILGALFERPAADKPDYFEIEAASAQVAVADGGAK